MSTLRSGTDDNLVNINIGRLLNRKCDGARWPPVASRNYPGSFRAGFYLLIDHSLREIRPDETRRNARHAQLIDASWRKPSEMAPTANFVPE